MARVTYVVQRPGEGPAILNGFRELARGVDVHRLTALYAFASHKGVRLFCEAMGDAVPNWPRVSKRWVLSVDGGITEPEALRHLIHQRNSEVRVLDAKELLQRTLRPIRRFHPKTLLFEADVGREYTPSAITVGSANLTCSGLCFGHEHSLSVRLSAKPEAEIELSRGLAELAAVVASATKIDERFVRRYESIRPSSPSIPEDFEDSRANMILQDRAVLRPMEAASLASANHLWVEIKYVVPNRGRSAEGNQIDLKRGTRVFFGFGDEALPTNSSIGSVIIQYADHSATRNLRFGNNHMDKLDLPIPGEQGPPSYRDRTLLFSREPDGSFRLAVGNSDEIKAWKERSRNLGTLFPMRGGRECGVF